MKAFTKILALLLSVVMLTSCSKKEPFSKDSFTYEKFQEVYSNYQYIEDEEAGFDYWSAAYDERAEVQIYSVFDGQASAMWDMYNSEGYTIARIRGYMVPADVLDAGGKNFYEHGVQYFEDNFNTDEYKLVLFEDGSHEQYIVCNASNFYGGYYICDDMVIGVYAYAGEGFGISVPEEAVAEIDRVLGELNLPSPSSELR